MAEASAFPAERFASWRAWCKERLARFPVVLPSYWAAGNKVNPYCFMDRLFAHNAQYFPDVLRVRYGAAAKF
jgi:acetolactate synthase-1/2/3 large subunit